MSRSVRQYSESEEWGQGREQGMGARNAVDKDAKSLGKLDYIEEIKLNIVCREQRRDLTIGRVRRIWINELSEMILALLSGLDH
jgi:hypothetical protein